MQIKKGRMTDREIMYIRDNASKKTSSEIADDLCRIVDTVEAIGEKIGVTFKDSE